MPLPAVRCAVAGALLLCPSCVTTAHGPSTGVLCTLVKGPISVATDAPLPDPVKVGTAESHSALLFTYGDASIEAAMQAGEITKVHHVDYELKSLFGVFTEFTTIVYGE